MRLLRLWKRGWVSKRKRVTDSLTLNFIASWVSLSGLKRLEESEAVDPSETSESLRKDHHACPCLGIVLGPRY